MVKPKVLSSPVNFSNLIYNCTLIKNVYYKSSNGRIIWRSVEDYLLNSIHLIKEKITSKSTTKTKSKTRERKSKV